MDLSSKQTSRTNKAERTEENYRLNLIKNRLSRLLRAIGAPLHPQVKRA